eukprot:scaffold272_cov31-Attheya_sp.AAC.1
MADPSSFATAAARVQHIHWNVKLDFDTKIIQGYVEHHVIFSDPENGPCEVVFDTKGLKISSVHLVEDGTPVATLPYKVLAGNKKCDQLGEPLVVTFLKEQIKEGHVAIVRIEYETSPSSSAIQWLPPAQTAGKVHPYLFTQCQAIHARSMLPCQDTPSNKCTYSAVVTVPSPLVALMSALSTGSQDLEDGTIQYTFDQKVPVPSYLIALAVGALEKRDIGPRSAVWSEKEMVEAGAYEFAETEDFLQAGEEIAGPYVWGRYDILLLPPSFPYGGMENPMLTFVTPTLLAGDRSLVNVVAHEIAHSWFGNLATSKTWGHFWMNEGFTVFLERKILKKLRGSGCYNLAAMMGLKALEDSVNLFGMKHPFTCLCQGKHMMTNYWRVVVYLKL